MKLFCIQFDGQSDYVEAADMGSAIRLWARANVVPREFDGTEEPESCTLVHDDSVIRADTNESAKPRIPASAVVRENYGIESVDAKQHGFPEGFAGRCHVAHSKMKPVHVRVVLADAIEVEDGERFA